MPNINRNDVPVPTEITEPRQTQTVYVVDQDGATFWHPGKAEAEAILVREAWGGAVHLTITEAQVPTDLNNADLTDWIIAHVPPITCGAQ